MLRLVLILSGLSLLIGCSTETVKGFNSCPHLEQPESILPADMPWVKLPPNAKIVDANGQQIAISEGSIVIEPDGLKILFDYVYGLVARNEAYETLINKYNEWVEKEDHGGK